MLVWPLVSHQRFLWSILEPLTPGIAEHTSVLATAEASVAIDAAWCAATRRCCADIFSMPYVGKSAPLYNLASRHAGLVAATEDVSSTALLRHEPDWTAFCDTLGALAKKKPGALERRFEKEGLLAIYALAATDIHAHAQWVDWMLARKRESANRRNAPKRSGLGFIRSNIGIF